MCKHNISCSIFYIQLFTNKYESAIPTLPYSLFSLHSPGASSLSTCLPSFKQLVLTGKAGQTAAKLRDEHKAEANNDAAVARSYVAAISRTAVLRIVFTCIKRCFCSGTTCIFPFCFDWIQYQFGNDYPLLYKSRYKTYYNS